MQTKRYKIVSCCVYMSEHDLDKFKMTYYTDNKKNIVFNKNAQKYDLAEKVCSEYGFDNLIRRTVYIIPNTNKVYMDYLVLKFIANPNNYAQIVNATFALCKHLIQTYGSFEFHANMDSFTVTAAERYKQMIELFCRDPGEDDIEFTKSLSRIYIYNTPSSINSMIQMVSHLFDPKILSIVVRHSKKDSPLLIQELHVCKN